MATIIPRSPGPQVAIEQGPTVRNTTRVDDSGTQALAAAIGSFARPALEYAKREQERNDTTAVMGARRQLSEWEASAFDPENPDGIGKFKGINALGADEALLPDLDKRVSDINAGLTARQRRQFEAVAMSFRDSVSGRLNTYMDAQHSGAIAAEQKASVDRIGADAVTAGMNGDFDRQDQVSNELLGMIEARGIANGAGVETIRAEQRGATSMIRASTIEGMATSQPFEAQAYLDRYRDQMLPEDRQRVESLLFPVVSAAEDDASADIIMAGGSPNDPADSDGGDVDALIIGLESGGDNSAKNPNSSATGAGQFLDSTWLDVVKRHKPSVANGKTDAEILSMRSDGALSREMVTAYRQDNARALSARGVKPTAINLYAAHHFGPAGAVRFATLGDDAPMTSVLSAKEIAANPYLKGRTIGDVKANWARRGMVSAPTIPKQRVPRTEAEAMAFADGIKDPRRRAGIKASMRQKYQIADMRRQEEEKAASEAAYIAINRTTNPNAPLREIIGAKAYALAEKNGSLGTLEAQRERRITGQFVQDDAVLVEALNREAVLSPTTFAKRDIYALSGRLSTPTLESMLTMQKQANDPKKRADWSNTQGRIDSGLRTLGLDEAGDYRNEDGETISKPSKAKLAERKTQRAQFALVYREAERAFIQTHGREPNPSEADTLLRNVINNVAEDIPKKLGRASAIEGFGAALPARDRAEIVSEFRAETGREPTEAEVVRIGARYRMQQNEGSN